MKGKAKLAVASIYDLPFEDGCFKALTLTFSPYSGEEYRRVLKENGLLYMVIPGSRHLWELKEVLTSGRMRMRSGTGRCPALNTFRRIGSLTQERCRGRICRICSG